jgi:hypothetical protein
VLLDSFCFMLKGHVSSGKLLCYVWRSRASGMILFDGLRSRASGMILFYGLSSSASDKTSLLLEHT